MPDKTRLNKPFLAQNVSEHEEMKHSSPEPQGKPAIPHDRRMRSRRSADAGNSIDDAMDVALGSEDEAWDRRRGERRKNAA